VNQNHAIKDRAFLKLNNYDWALTCYRVPITKGRHKPLLPWATLASIPGQNFSLYSLKSSAFPFEGNKV